MKVMSGKTGFIYDLKNDILLDSGLVAHGFGSRIKADGGQKFSNESGSLCSSLAVASDRVITVGLANLQITWVRCHQRQIIL
jgi:hypothetical protein